MKLSRLARAAVILSGLALCSNPAWTQGPVMGGGPLPAESAEPLPDLTADWPCIQRKVATLTSAQIWDGPPVEGLTGWDGEPRIKDLVPVLASRRVPVEEAAKDIKAYAGSLPEAERDQKLALLFAALLAEINRDRATVVNGIETFQKRQRLRSAELEREGVKTGEIRDKNPGTDDQPSEELTKATELYNWNARIFQERQKSIPLACEIPVLMEQRAFDLGREIRANMKG